MSWAATDILWQMFSCSMHALAFGQNARPIGNQLMIFEPKKDVLPCVSSCKRSRPHTLSYLSSAQNLVLGTP